MISGLFVICSIFKKTLRKVFQGGLLNKTLQVPLGTTDNSLGFQPQAGEQFQAVEHEVFTLNEFHSFLSSKGTNNQHTRKSLLTYYRKQGRITSIKRGLYAVIPTDTQPELFPVDPLLIASKMTSDAVLGYHGLK